MIASSAYDGASVYQAAFLRQRDRPPDIVILPRVSSVINAENAGISTVRDRHVQHIAEKGRMARQKAIGYGRRNRVETVVGRYKHIVGPKPGDRSFDR